MIPTPAHFVNPLSRFFIPARLLAACVIALGMLTGCDSQDQQDLFAERANQSPSGITRTDVQGRQLEEDPDDWQTAPFFLGKIAVDPPFPNPTSGEAVVLQVNIFTFDSFSGGLILRAFDTSGRFVRLDEILTGDPGFHTFTFSPAVLGTVGLHRLFIFDRLGELISYGDLLVE